MLCCLAASALHGKQCTCCWHACRWCAALNLAALRKCHQNWSSWTHQKKLAVVTIINIITDAIRTTLQSSSSVVRHANTTSSWWCICCSLAGVCICHRAQAPLHELMLASGERAATWIGVLFLFCGARTGRWPVLAPPALRSTACTALVIVYDDYAAFDLI